MLRKYYLVFAHVIFFYFVEKLHCTLSYSQNIFCDSIILYAFIQEKYFFPLVHLPTFLYFLQSTHHKILIWYLVWLVVSYIKISINEYLTLKSFPSQIQAIDPYNMRPIFPRSYFPANDPSIKVIQQIGLADAHTFRVIPA